MAIRVAAGNTLDTHPPALPPLAMRGQRPARGNQETAAAALEMVATASCLQRMSLQMLHDELHTLMALTGHQPRLEKLAAAMILDLAADVSRAHRHVLRAQTVSLSGPLAEPVRTEQQLLQQGVHADLRAVLTALDQCKASRRCVRQPAWHPARPMSDPASTRTVDSAGTPAAPLAEAACCDDLCDALRTTRWILVRLSGMADPTARRATTDRPLDTSGAQHRGHTSFGQRGDGPR